MSCMLPRSGGIQILSDQGFFPTNLGLNGPWTAAELTAKGFEVWSTQPMIVLNPDINVLAIAVPGGGTLGHVLVLSPKVATRYDAFQDLYGGWVPEDDQVVEYWTLNPVQPLPSHFQLVDSAGYNGPVEERDVAAPEPALNQGSFAQQPPAAAPPASQGRVFEIWVGGPGAESHVGWLHLSAADANGDGLEVQHWYAKQGEAVSAGNNEAALLPSPNGVWDFVEILPPPLNDPWDNGATYAEVAEV